MENVYPGNKEIRKVDLPWKLTESITSKGFEVFQWLVIARVVLSVVSLSRNYVIPETFCYSVGQVEISISWQLVRDVQSKPAHSKVLSSCLNTKLIDMLIHHLVQLLYPNLN